MEKLLLVLLLFLSEHHQAHGQSNLQRGYGWDNNDRDNNRYNGRGGDDRGGRQSCRDGERAVGYCSWSGRCSIPTAHCRNQFCCISGVNPTSGVCSSFNQRELGPCINGGCQTGATCIGGRCCTGNGTGNGSVCPAGQLDLGVCLSNLCQNGATCVNGRCCISNIGSGQCPSGTTIIGPCVSNSCPPNAKCINNNICCTVVG